MKQFEGDIHTYNKHLSSQDFYSIFECLKRGLNLTDTAKYLNCSISTVKKAIDRYKILKRTRKKNICGKKLDCYIHHVCGNSNCVHRCALCVNPTVNCNYFCKDFDEKPQCKLLKKLCGVCNFCPKVSECTLNKFFFYPEEALKQYKTNVQEAHKGVRISQAEAEKISQLIKPYVDKNISLVAIKSSLDDKLPYSVQTLYTYIEDGVIPGINNILLPRKVKYKVKKGKKEEVIFNRDYLNGRTYEFFLEFITNNPYCDVVEMDTVEGCNKESYILTLLFRSSNYMMAFKLKDHTSQSVIDIFDDIKQKIGIDTFKTIFPVILTDRGSEFSSPEDIEIDKNTGEVLSQVFYCDSRQSQQKGKIEKNHVELRKIFPKGTDFNKYSQKDLDKALSYINSYPRKSLNLNSPIDVVKTTKPECVLELNHAKKIALKDIDLKPFKK